ncbi:uncharacterized protein LOC116250249 isoform X3 [Nymphaea colorata]|uniref:uncharacterized protein LOC116250249 isoform X3 n=1 Tax=Nymphaea colorata TaxID=210225 RepID=UPI00129DAB23|nr:uncharacterized protein LOC116250249 isoform X3 [Nymphaea colorata]
MFEAHVSHLLKKYLGDYVQGLSAEALRISVWKGDVVLRDLQLKAEALNSLKLPVIVKGGFIGTITLKVPWKSLGKEPVIVIIDRVFILAHPAPDGRTLTAEDRQKLFQAKLHQIEEAESTILEAKDRKYKLENASDGNSWLGSLIATIIGNLKISITNVHIRYEDSMTNSGHPFCVGITLAKLAAVTMDENGNETFDTSGALDKLRKSVQLQRLAMYHDPDCEPWKVDKNWMDLSPKEWIEIFEDGINDPGPNNSLVSKWAMHRKFLVSPINGVLKYHRLGNQERKDPNVPFEKASLVLSDVSITILEAQYYDGIKLLEVISRYKTHVDISHLRPKASPSKNARAWWHYAVQAVLQQKKMWLSWERVQSLCQLRRRYVQLYANFLQQISLADNAEIRDIERDLDSKIILLWRLLAHAKVETVKTIEIARQKSRGKKSWWSFGWGASSKESVALSYSPGADLLEEQRLTKEEWQAINKLLSYQTEEGLAWPSGKDMEKMMQYLVNVSIGTAAARIINIEQTEILCGKFEQLQVSARLYPKSIQCDMTLKLWGLSSPEGSLVQSVSNEKKVNALAATFVYSPSEKDVDWRLSANIAPCHVTVLMGSYDRLLELIRRSNAISPVVASETATALQTKLERVTKRAQEQFQLVLEEQSRFSLDIDFDAPKVRVPLVSDGSFDNCGHLLLDFGHFTVQTKEGADDDQKQSFYSRFYISGRDITAFFLGSPSSDAVDVYAPLNFDCPSPSFPLTDGVNGVSSLIDRFGALLIIDQTKVPHPSYPPTRVSVQVPNLAIHFSPSRYSKILDLLNIIYETTKTSDSVANGHTQTSIAAWYPSDLATDARILVWTGIGHSTAEWRPCFLILSNLHLYALDSEASQTYRRCISMVGRQVFEVSPTNVDGSLFSIAVSYRGLTVQKALESSTTMIVEFGDDELKTTWMRALVQATYKASVAPPAMDMLTEPPKGTEEPDIPRADTYGNADLVVNVNLVTMKLMIYGEVEEKEIEKYEETLIIELLASGGKVNVVNWGGDLTVNTKLHCLQIKDEFQGRLSGATKYLARSVLQKSDDDVVRSCDITDPSCPEVVDEDDVFRDALPDFVANPEQSFYLQRNHEISCLVPFSSEVVDIAGNQDEDKVKLKNLHGEMFYEAQDDTLSDFVVVTFLTRHPGSLIYEGIDVQMCIRMSKLEFYCNRATLVALTKFGLDLSMLNSGGSQTASHASASGSTQTEERNEANEHSYVRGLLGYGKDRVVFYLKMDVNSVCIYLNKEDGSQLAMLVQENFLLDLKMHPSSISIEGTLGNLRLCDMSLGMDHCWGWLCDLRNSGVESLIKFKFQSYNIGEDDYDGYDYSLSVRLSAVRIVFLYRFVQEIMAYFWELATPQTEEAIKLVDKVRGIEWLIQKYEIDGATALKLDLLLDTPIIIVPRNSRSKDFMQLDLGRLIVRNNFSWHGCKDGDPSAVHLDVLHAEVQGINMAVGIEGTLGRPMVKEGQGLHIHVRRSLRDVFRKVPTLSIDFKVGLLHSIMSDKEYNVIVNCFYMNISEEPKLPPSFRGRASVPKETIRMLADKVNVNSQVLLSRTVTLVTVEVSYALMELYNGFDKSSPLAHISLEGLWVSYRTTSLWETDIYVTIPKFSIVDIRPDAKQEMCLMLGSSSDIFRQRPYRDSDLSCAHSFSLSCDDPSKSACAYVANEDPPNLTMLLMDYKLRSSSQSFVFRIQQPRVLVVLDFLLAVGEFFVPALGAITGRDEIMHSHNDPITQSGHILLSTPLYQQTEDIVYLSPHRKLIADGSDVDEFVYDGCGGTICLTDEFDLNGDSMVTAHPIVIIGRGKKLRFKKVKFENGALLLKGTYLNNDSSYTVYEEDGVHVTYLDGPDESSLQHLHIDDIVKATTSAVDAPNNSSLVNCFTFEAQVVSPEFTFYDTTNISMNDSLQCEKFLRAKMDINFMFASKEKDTWVRALVKDLSIEAGSGLVVLDPIDISGGYTSVNEKTNISVQCTDICIHLPLSVISLVLHLENEAFAALQIGNENFLSPCTNFKQIWASEKGNSSGSNLCIWRPQPPSNYAILGDCVTFGPVPPSQAVMAVSNTYGRVQKAAGFNFVGSLSSICGVEDSNSYSDDEHGCSLWMPIPPTGYKAMGCVAHIGSKPPPNHIVYCIRADLVTSAAFLDCVLYLSPNPRFLTGFSIWLIENVVGSFYAHSTVEYPSKCLIFDFHEILRRNMNKPIPYMNDLPVDPSIDDGKSPNDRTPSSNSSSSDVLRSISKFNGYYMSTPNFERIWWDRGSEVRRPVSIWRAVARPGFSILGDCIAEGFEPPALGLVFRSDNSGISAKPLQFTKVAHISGKGIEEAFFWFPVAPPGYASLGCVVSRVDQCPSLECICCLRIDLVNQATILDKPVSCFVSSKASQSWSIWRVDNQANTFLARSDQTKPSNRLAYCIGDSVRPKANENISGELKLKCFSLTILDDSCGMMTPVFDTTITNLNLATHGRPEAMSAVLICSIAASTFNAQLEAWEPLIEPFDGIFKYESYKANLHLSNNIGKRVRVAATSTMNVNISAANIEAFVGLFISWRNQTLFRKKILEDGMKDRSLMDSDDATNSALEETDPHNVVVENKLGSDIYLKIWGDNSENCKLIRTGESTLAWFPPPSFSDRFNVAIGVHEFHRFVAVHVFESRGLTVNDDGNQHDFFCALRLVPSNQTSDQQKLFPQSARTRCIRPVVTGPDKTSEYVVRWNELFIFEVPQKGPANLEVEVTNLGAKAGKGEVIGVFSIPISDGASAMNPKFARISSRRHDLPDFASYPLRKKGHVASDGDVQLCGSVLVSTSYFERKVHGVTAKDLNVKVADSDIGFWVALGLEGPWTGLRRLLPLATAPKELNGDFFAFDVAMKKGKKHVTFRSLATVVNDTDLNLEICVCPLALIDDVSSISTLDTNKSNAVTEEIFENQRYQPVSGWTSKCPGISKNDPGPWSTRDYSHSSKDFFEPALPNGWKWTSDWTIDKSLFVDNEGWAYASDFQSLKWPPLSSRMCRKSVLDFVRRRRWIRIRELFSETTSKISRVILPIIKPGSSLVLPWKSMINSEPLCLQVRPFVEGCQDTYFWTRTITNDPPSFIHGNNERDAEGLAFFSRSSTNQSGPVCAFMLNQLEKKDMLLFTTRCNNKEGAFWFSIGTDASILQTELNSPVYDWRISLSPPIKLENKLPYHAEYSIWEKDEGNRIKVHNGIVSRGCSAFIYSADVRKPIYLSWMAEGGWVSEKDSVLILDPALGHVSSFWLVNQKKNRKLRVSVEHDLGGTVSASKTVRIFVPYWISNDSGLPLSCQMVEVEPSEKMDNDSLLLSRVVKSAKFSLKPQSSFTDLRRSSSSKRNLQLLEDIKELGSSPVMLSPQDYANHGNILPFASRSGPFLSPRIGIAVALSLSNHYSPGISLMELENKEHVNVNAFSPSGSYYKLSASISMKSDRTKVVHFRPHTVLINRLGRTIALKQCDTQPEDWFHPHHPPKPFQWRSTTRSELLKMRLEGFKWSTPFSVESEGVMCIKLKSDVDSCVMYVRVEVRKGSKISRYQVIICPVSSSSPYRIENQSTFLPIRFRQVNGTDDSWRPLPVNSAVPFFWEDLGRQRLIEVMIDGAGSMETVKCNIDEPSDPRPLHFSSSSSRALCVSVLKEESLNVVKFTDWTPSNNVLPVMPRRFEYLPQLSMVNHKESPSDCTFEFHVIIELAELGLSVIDHTPEEIIYLSVQNFLLTYSTDMGSRISRFKLQVAGIQLDNQLPLTPMPVLFRHQKTSDELEHVLKLSVTVQSDGSSEFCVYPHIGVQGPQGTSFLVKIHEPILWRLHEMFQKVNLSNIVVDQTTTVPVDPVIQIGLLNISEIRFKVSVTMSPTLRPRGVLGFWASLMTALGNMENMPIRINQRFLKDISVRKSSISSAAFSSIQKDLLSRPLHLLSGVDILGNASSALGNMSKGVAALSMDKKFIQSRQRQGGKGTVEDIGDVIREGGGALAKGLFRGVTGILTKPLEGAKSSGVEGFVQGVGKGIIGAAAQPVSGVLDLLSKTTEGANAVRMKITSAIASEEQLLRRRLPRVISGDNVLRPYDEYKAQGQIILQLAESGAIFGQADLFKVRGKFALSDSYEDHFILPKGMIVVITHRRVLLLQILAQGKFNPSRDPCSVLWDVSWSDLHTMELTYGRKDDPKSPPSLLVLYLHRTAGSKENIRVIECLHESHQALEIYASIEQAMNTFGPNHFKEMKKRKVKKPYSPSGATGSGSGLKEVLGVWTGQEPMLAVPISSTFGTLGSAETQSQSQMEKEH